MLKNWPIADQYQYVQHEWTYSRDSSAAVLYESIDIEGWATRTWQNIRFEGGWLNAVDRSVSREEVWIRGEYDVFMAFKSH